MSLAQAGEFCSTINGGNIDGNIPSVRTALSTLTQITIDSDCTFKNFPASDPLTVTLNFQTNDPSIYLIVFDNVVYTGNMACSNVDHKLWFVNGSDYGSGNSCQDLFLPVESIGKQEPGPTAAIGEPFIYTLTIPVMYDKTTNTWYNNPSPNTIGNVKICDDLTVTGLQGPDYYDPALMASGADLTYLGNTAFLVNGATRTPLGPLNLSGPDSFCPNASTAAGTKVLYFTDANNPDLVKILGSSEAPPGTQIEIQMQVVANNSATNTPGTTFINTAKWWFSRSVDLDDNGIIEWAADTNGDGIFDTGDDADGDGKWENEFFDPLPGEWGVTGTMTIDAPDLVVTKSSPASTLNLGIDADFTVDIQNTGGATAWNATIVDQLPDIPGSIGMCPAVAPSLSAIIYAADGTPLRLLSAGTDYTLTYNNDAAVPPCQFTINLLSANAAIAPNEYLRLGYTLQLDADTAAAADGTLLTNVVGATQWYSADPTGPYPVASFTRTLTDGTPGVADHQDEHAITATLSGYYFQKSVINVNSGANPALTAVVGDTLRYRLNIQNFAVPPLDPVTITDELSADFQAGTLTIVDWDLPGGAALFPNSTGGANGTGSILVANLFLQSNVQYFVEYEVQLRSDLLDGTSVVNQASMSGQDGPTTVSGLSDDPNAGTPAVVELRESTLNNSADPTVVTIVSNDPLSKTTGAATATIGEQFIYTITVPSSPASFPLYDVQIVDDLSALAAQLSLVNVTAALTNGTVYSVVDTDPTTALRLENTSTGIDIPVGEQAIITLTVQVDNVSANQAGVSAINTATYNYNRQNGVSASQVVDPATAGTATAVTIVEPAVSGEAKSYSYISPAGKLVGDPATAGDVVEYSITATNSGTSWMYDASVADTLPPSLSLVPGSAKATINGSPVVGFIADPLLQPGGVVVWGDLNGDGTLDIPVNGTLVLSYQVTVDSANGLPIVNSAYVDWTSLDGASASERSGDGCPIVTDPDLYCSAQASVSIDTADPTTITKSVVSDSYPESPVTTPPSVRIGDTVIYRLTLELREGLLPGVTVSDTLPAGLLFDGVVSVNGDATAPYSQVAPFSHADIPAANLPAVGQGGTVTWNLGDITNAVDNDPTNNSFIIEYRARVVKDALAQASATARTNSATLSYTGVPGILSSSADISVVQPVMTTPTKTASGFTSPASVDIVTDVMPFHLESCNTTGQAPAYGLTFTDALATQMNETSLTTPVVKIDGTTLTAGTDYSYTPPAGRGGTMSFVLKGPVNPGQCASIDYTIGFHDDIAPNQSWVNNVTLAEYWSLATPTTVGQQYGPLTSADFVMTNPVTVQPLTKAVSSPLSGEATIGEEVVYQITVPATPVNAALDNVVVSDTLNGALEYVAATAVDDLGAAITLIDNSVAPGSVSLAITQIPAGRKAIITLRTRIANNAAANAGVSFTNTASYSYTNIPGGSVTDGSSGAVTIVEPLLGITKGVAPATAPNAGDILTYTVLLTAQSGADKSTAFDTTLVDTLSLGLTYVGGTATVGGVASEPVVTGDGVNSAQTLTWGSGLDIAEGATVQVVYEVLVLNDISAGQVLANSMTASWTSLDGPSAFERDGSGAPNDYVATAASSLTVGDDTSLAKLYASDTYNDASSSVRVGDFIEYELRLGLQEGTTNGVVVSDTLPAGMVYDALVSITPASGSANFSYTLTSQPLQGATGTVSWNLGSVVNAGDNDPSNDFLTLRYRARVLNNGALSQTPTSQALINSASLDYLVGGIPATPKSATLAINVLQPLLSVTKLSLPASGSTVAAGQTVSYTVEVTNSGAAPAYDTVVQDILPPGMRQGGVTTTSMTLVGAGTPLPLIAPVYDPANGIATWDLDNGGADTYTIPPGDTLRIVYTVQTDASLAPGLTLTNAATATLYYSFDDEALPTGGIAAQREDYGPSNTAQTTLNSGAAVALEKAITQSSAAVGEPFSYLIAVPASPQPTALNDVRILDDLSASAADLSFVSATVVSGGSWNLVNSGTSTNLILEDLTTGIDIPANGQAVIEITVVLADTATNVTGLLFNNSADYTYNIFNDDSVSQATGLPGTSADMTIAGPDTLTMIKSGPTTMRLGLPATFTLDVQNTGTGTAWDMTIVDQLPQLAPTPTPGGMCDVAPSNISAQVFQSDGTTPVSGVLTVGSDYTVSFNSAPSCTLTLTMQSAAAAVGAGERLIVQYDTLLDYNSLSGTTLTNIAAATEWFSADTAGAGATGSIRTYSGTLSDGTVGTSDEQDAHSVLVESPVLLFQKSVVNATTGQNPGSNATPGDTLRYTLYVENVSPVILPNFSISDELDALNATALFAPGSLTVISAPVGADMSNTDPNGGSRGSGLLDIRNLSLDAQGGANDRLSIIIEATLLPVIDSGTIVRNQAQLSSFGFLLNSSDDPNINGADDPNISGDENPTETLIDSAPLFEIWKTSQDVTGDPAVLMAGDTLRYTITVKNIGTENAVNTVLRDALPSNTTYVAGSTTLNGNPVADPAAGTSPLEAGTLINAPEDTTPGAMRGDATATTSNLATITFDVQTSPSVVDGTVIANQGFVTANGAGTSGVVAATPSDDPATATLLDPTRDIVGNLPLIDAVKTVALQLDNNGNGSVDPGDRLRYTITISNNAASPANNVVFTDAVPANTSYVADSVLLNGLAVGQPDGGTSPLIAGIPVSSSDLPAPTPGNGVLSAGGTATIIFDVQVNAAVAAGTIISNQGTVSSNEQAPEPTDADGIDSNGDQPTEIVVGAAQQLAITKEVFVLGGGVALPGGELEYVVRVQNIGTVPATSVNITDSLDLSKLSYVANSATLNGLSTGVSYSSPLLSADYAATYGDLPAGASAELRFRVQINGGLATGTTISNSGTVVWNTPSQSASASVSLNVGALPGVATLTGQLWHDGNADGVPSSGETLLAGWTVELYRNGSRIGSVTSDANGVYQITGLAANDTTSDQYALRFVAPWQGANSAQLGVADSPFVNSLQRIDQIVAGSGAVVQGLNLPIRPNGVVYNSMQRLPIAGVQLSLLDAATGQPLPAGCFDDPAQQGQLTPAEGYYRFDLNFNDPACLPGADYLISVVAPATGYEGNVSAVIPPLSDGSTAPFSVPACLGTSDDAVPATVDLCEVTALASLPPLSIAPRTAGTNYYLHLTLNNNLVPGESQAFNNHIPLDPVLTGAVAITKTAAKVNASRGEMIPYTITATNNYTMALQGMSIVDTFPPGFKYVTGSARLDGQPVEPVIIGNQLRWDNLAMQVDGRHTIKLLFVPGAGVSEGDYVNRAQMVNSFTNSSLSEEATATVRLIPDPTFDCTDVIGKVFDDKNLDGVQGEGEPGMAGVRLVSARGLIVTTDSHGRFHLSCAVVPNESRGSNFILKLDERSLPTGYRVTSENPRVLRATRGKALKFGFATTIHRVVRLDVADGVFEKGSDTMRRQWQTRLPLLLEELKKGPSILRLSYLADVEAEGLVADRMATLKRMIVDEWDKLNCCYKLTIEGEVYWRRGAPPSRSGILD